VGARDGKWEEDGGPRGEMLQGTLDMLILRTLVMGAAHGHTIAQVIEHTSEQALEVEQGSLYPALHRLEDRGLVSAKWGVSENNRRAKFYQLTAAGETEVWRRRPAVGAGMTTRHRFWSSMNTDRVNPQSNG